MRLRTRSGVWLMACCLVAVVACAQDDKKRSKELPRIGNESCDPPVTTITFGRSTEKTSRRIQVLFDEDQARESTLKQGKDWETINVEDRKRQKEIMGYLEKGEVNSAGDLYHAAMIFQHGNCAEHYRLANRLAELALAKGSDAAKWLYAATLDRYLMSQGKPQTFGTQFLRDGPKGKWQLYPVDPETTDAERARYNVPALEAQRQNPKARHHKRRFVNPKNLEQMARVLTPGAEFRIASDIMDYARWTLEHVMRHEAFAWTAEQAADWRGRPADWPATRYEQKALREGRPCVYLRFIRR